MRIHSIILSLALLSQSATAFLQVAAPVIKQQCSFATTKSQHDAGVSSSCLYNMSKYNNNESSSQDVVPQSQQQTKKRRVVRLSKLSQLSALTQLKKDNEHHNAATNKNYRRTKFNKHRLLKMGITIAAAFISVINNKTSSLARAATPLVVHEGGSSIIPLVSSYPALSYTMMGVGVVEMPGMKGISPTSISYGLPNDGAVFFALAVFLTTALLRNAGEGYVKMVHFMHKFMTKMLLIKDHKERSAETTLELGLPHEIDWNTYEHSMLDPLQKKKKKQNNKSTRYWLFDPRINMFELIKSKTGLYREEEAIKLEKANKAFIEQKYKQHHHPVHVAHSTYIKTAYLDALPVNNEEEGHDAWPERYLDTLNYNAKRSTWDVYKDKLEEVKPVSETDELKQELLNLQTLMQDEQSMYQTSNQALKLAMDAHTEELHQSSNNDELKQFDAKLNTNEELKAFDMKAQEYENTVVKDAAEQEDKTTTKKKENWWSI